MRCRSFALLFLPAVLLAACGQDGGNDQGSAPSSTIAIAASLPATEASPATTTTEATAAATTTEPEARSMPPVPSSTIMSSTTVPPTTVRPIVTTTTEREPFAVEWARPSGSFELDPNDVVALRDDGALVLFRGIRDAAPRPEVLVDDVTERIGDGGELAEVAGVVEGALVVGSCCDDDGGLWSLDESGGRLSRFADGEHPVYSRDRDWLVATGSDDAELLVHDVPSSLVTSPPFDAQDGDVRGIVWASDDESWFVLVTDAAGSSELVRVEARPPFAELGSVSLDPLFEDADTAPQLAGLGPSGEIGLWAVEGDAVVIRFVDVATLTERPDRERTLSPTATSVRIGPDGGGLLWVDGGTLRYLPLFETERVLGDGYVAAWFVG